MTATDELRRMLDERGIEYTTLSYSDATWWTDTNGLEWCYEENRASTHLTCCSFRITPAQAIAATLGTGTCRLVETEHEQEIFDGGGYFSYWSYDCDECGHENTEYGRFCAGCGRKVVGE